MREVREELGLDRALGRLLVIDYLPDDGRMPEGMAFVFDGGLVTDEEIDDITLTDPEIVSVSLCSLDEATHKVKPALRARLGVALETRRGDPALCRRGERIAR